jgi:hypothetical protein
LVLHRLNGKSGPPAKANLKPVPTQSTPQKAAPQKSAAKSPAKKTTGRRAGAAGLRSTN